jgi:hypothetical protein
MIATTPAPEWDDLDCYELPCTCHQTPNVVNLDFSRENSAFLVQNLQTFGWSPLQISCRDSPPSQEKIQNVFREYKRKRQADDITYIAAESGSTQGTVEPKESLQVQLATCCSDNIRNSDNADPQHQIRNWCTTLSWIAHQVCETLDLPPDTFLSSTASYSLDLLRIFHYFALDDGNINSQDDIVLGSSPHTDWGSLTIVWQDQVGGLQTYCRKCQTWIDVPPPPLSQASSSDHWQVIVHVGDMASLVLNALSDKGQPSRSLWPSPKHRVVSSKTQDRVSLVYFAYPPAQTSLASLHQTLLHQWPLVETRNERRRHGLPLEEYYLLHDQGIGSTTAKTPHDMYHEIWNLPVQDVVQFKWKQVNRGDENENYK